MSRQGAQKIGNDIIKTPLYVKGFCLWGASIGVTTFGSGMIEYVRIKYEDDHLTRDLRDRDGWIVERVCRAGIKGFINSLFFPFWFPVVACKFIDDKLYEIELEDE